MQTIKTNYHTHHELCGHAKGNGKDYINAAIKEGFKAIGISDHAPSTLHQNSHVRMPWSKFHDYVDELNEAKKGYSDKIKVFIGLETEYTEPNKEYYEYLLTYVDYMILGQHFVPWKDGKHPFKSGFNLNTKEQILAYGAIVEKAIKSGYYVAVAHPDVYMSGYDSFDDTAKKVADQIIHASIEQNIPLEINAQGIRKGLIESKDGTHYRYPRKEFFKRAKELGATFMVGSDAHDPKHLNDDAFKEALRFSESLDLTLVEKLTIE